ncbi:MAG TPA: PEP-CTERM sorting domain-containing protein [Lacipirellula sp.]
MHRFKSLRALDWRLPLVAALIVAPVKLKADTVLSSFEGDLSTAIGTPWKFYDASGVEGEQLWPHQFVSEGATDGAQALEITHFNNWTHGFNLQPDSDQARLDLIELFATHDTLEFDITAPPATSWRQIFVIVNSSPTNWSQVQIDIPANTTTHFTMPLTNPDPTDASKNWKQSAIDGGPTATYWEIFVALQGADLAPTADFDFDSDVDGTDFLIWQQNVGSLTAEEGDANFDGLVDGVDLGAWEGELGRSSTTASIVIDNIKFGGGASSIFAVPEPSTLVGALLAIATFGLRRTKSRSRQQSARK